MTNTNINTPEPALDTPIPAPAEPAASLSVTLSSYLRAALYLLLLLTMLGFTGRLFWWADYFAHPRLHLAALTGIAGLLLLLMRQWTSFLFACVGIVFNIVAITSAISESPFIRNTNGVPPGELSVIQINVNSASPDNLAISRFITASKPDILILTGANKNWIQMLDGLVPILQYQKIANHSGEYGSAILSRFPLDKVDIGTAGPRSLPVIKVELETEIGRIAVVSVHGDAPTSGNATHARDHYFSQVSAMIQTDGLPTIVAGNFNATPWSSGYEALRLLPNLQPESIKVPPTWPAALGPLGLPTNNIMLSIPYKNQLPIELEQLTAGPMLPGLGHLPLIAHFKIR